MIHEISLSITSNCNLSCKHCLATKTQGMSLAKIKEIIDDCGEMKLFKINIFGGEPLVRSDIFEIIDYINKYPINLSINTNATLIDDNNAEQLIKKGIRYFTVSLDGSNEYVSSLMRGKGIFERTINGIKSIIKKGGLVAISTIVTKTNKDDLENIIKLGQTLKVSKVRFNAIYKTGDAIKNEKSLFLNVEEQEKVFYEINRLMKIYDDFITGSYVDNVKLIKKWENDPPKGNNIHVQPCGAGTVKINIKPNGKITACELMWDNEIGDLNNTSLKDFLKKTDSLKMYQNSFSIDEKQIGDCIDCIYREICYNGHRCTPYYLPKGIKEKDVFCISKIGPTKKPIFNLDKKNGKVE